MCPLTHDATANAATKAAANVAPNTAFGAAGEMPNSSVGSRLGGRGLFKQLAIFESFYDPACLADDKLQSNLWEEQWGQEWLNQGLFSQTPLSQTPLSKGFDISEGTKGDNPDRTIQRPINIDPGYISMTKLVLASTKNREHRLYLRDGIYAEVTLAFRDQRWQPMGWTYADYQRDDVLEFLTQGRQWFTKQVASHRHRAELAPMHDKPAANNAGPNPINGA
jgi:hypothetical protein